MTLYHERVKADKPSDRLTVKDDTDDQLTFIDETIIFIIKCREYNI